MNTTNNDRHLPKPLCIHQVFEAQADKTPDALAVTYPTIGDNQYPAESLTYQALNQRANRLAHYLRSLGVKAETPVGLYVERSLDMVIGLLGILKAGGAYVPLDPVYPRERLQWMIHDTTMPLLLTQQALSHQLPETPARILRLDASTDAASITSQPTVNPSTITTERNLAYIIYTSGSTGQPKGVQIEHRGVVNLAETQSRRFQFNTQDTWTVFHSYAFDFSVWELWTPLLSGGRLVIVPQWVTRASEAFYDLLCTERVTILNQTPSAVRQLLFTRGYEVEDWSVRLLICGGEALPRDLARQLLQWRVPLWNFYGPTEATVWATTQEVTPDIIETQSGNVPIGYPLANAEVYVLDNDLNPVPPGETGELHIGGIGLARGYLNQPALTAEKFIPHPWHKPRGEAKLYKTGDLARVLPNDAHSARAVEFLGRLDHQIKLRGHRIELGEIETVLRQHPHVKDTLVLARAAERSANDSQLVAYVIPEDITRTSAGEDTSSAPQESEAGAEVKASSSTLQNEYVAQWEAVWDDAYRAPEGSLQDPTFNTRGWNSSYTGRPVPQAEVREWVQTTVARILALNPRRVLEIGCGTGLLLFKVAPHCIALQQPDAPAYVATDIAQSAITYLQDILSRAEYRLPHVKLQHQAADDFSGLEPETFDTVIINGVTQYFPNAAYLLDVLEGAARVTQPGGHIFIGDARSLPLLETYHFSVQVHRAPDTLTTAHLMQRVKNGMLQEEELVIDPDFFYTLRHRMPQIRYVEIYPKQGQYHNEFTKFRYDAILHVGETPARANVPQWLDWQSQNWTVDKLRQYLSETQPNLMGLMNIPNARLAREHIGLALVNTDTGSQPDTVKALRAAIDADVSKGSNTPITAVDPQTFWSLQAELPYRIYASWAHHDATGTYAVALQHLKQPVELCPAWPEKTPPSRSWQTYTNTPMQGKFIKQRVPMLRAFLKDKLPNYMLPSAFVMLEAFPRTANDKIDRQALPAPHTTRPVLSTPYTAPRNQREDQLATLWSDILGLEDIGVHDDFFELGGHSLLATQLISRLSDMLQVNVPLRALFEHPNVADMADYVEALLWATHPSTHPHATSPSPHSQAKHALEQGEI